VLYVDFLFQETGVRSMVFHPDGKTLFCGLDQSLKVGLFFMCYLDIIQVALADCMCIVRYSLGNQ
jgi:hypothetical protein